MGDLPPQSETVALAREIAARAGVPLIQVWAYFSFVGRLPIDVQRRISAAEVAVLGFGRTQKAIRRRLRLHDLGDCMIENLGDCMIKTEGRTAAQHDAA